MGPNDPILTVLLYSSLAAATAGLGVLPFVFRDSVPQTWVGSAYALASGLMLGAGYLLIQEGLNGSPVWAVVGFGLGAVYTYWSQAYAGTAQLDTSPEHNPDNIEGYKTILQNALHSASEGVAIGAAMVLSLGLGCFLAFSMAVHNIGEAMALTSILGKRRMSLAESAGLCVITNVPQVLLAIVVFALRTVFQGAQPTLLGFASGALVFLLMTELLPASYQRCGSSWIAVLVSFSAGAVVLLEGVLL